MTREVSTEETSDPIAQAVLRAAGKKRATRADRIQSLWSGYGEIVRYRLGSEGEPDLLSETAARTCVVVKHVTPPASSPTHPRGWGSNVSHERKLRSYRVEREFYEKFAGFTTEACRVPRPLLLEETESGWLFVLEDLDAAGFEARRAKVTQGELRACLSWLAHFHARFLGKDSGSLWEVGTYWHLGTRPEELSQMKNASLKGAASAIDERLKGARYQTLVHGDAKVANFCFPEGQERLENLGVAAVDFQYVGGGVGVKDVAYFLSSVLTERECEAQADAWLDEYFVRLRSAVTEKEAQAGFEGPRVNLDELESEWRALYPFAWADFMRFLNGWAPEHYKIHGYSLRMTELALGQL